MYVKYKHFDLHVYGGGGGVFLLLTKLLDVFIGSIAFKK